MAVGFGVTQAPPSLFVVIMVVVEPCPWPVRELDHRFFSDRVSLMVINSLVVAKDVW